jgi:hypothetical protein
MLLAAEVKCVQVRFYFVEGFWPMCERNVGAPPGARGGTPRPQAQRASGTKRYGFKTRSVQRAGTPALPTGRNLTVTLFQSNGILTHHAMEKFVSALVGTGQRPARRAPPAWGGARPPGGPVHGMSPIRTGRVPVPRPTSGRVVSFARTSHVASLPTRDMRRATLGQRLSTPVEDARRQNPRGGTPRPHLTLNSEAHPLGVERSSYLTEKNHTHFGRRVRTRFLKTDRV